MRKGEELTYHAEGDTLESLPGYEVGGAAYDGYASAVKRMHMNRYLRAVRRHRWLIAVFTIAVTALVGLYETRQPSWYRATSRIEINPDTSFAVAPGRTVSASASGSFDPLYFSSQLQIIEGPGLLRRVARDLDLEHDAAFLVAVRGKGGSRSDDVAPPAPAPDGADVAPPADPVDAASTARGDVDDPTEIERLTPYVTALKASLTVAPVRETRMTFKDTRLVDVSFTHTDSRVAAKIANAIADTYLAMNLEKKTRTGVTTGDFLQKRVVALQAQIRSGEERLVGYARTNQIISLDAAQNTVVQRLADLNARLAQAESDRIAAEAAYRSAGAPETATAAVDSTDVRVGGFLATLGSLQQQRAQLLVEHTEQAPEVVEIDRQIAVVQASYDDARRRAAANLTTGLASKFHELQTREQDLRRAFESQRDQVLSQNEASINYRIIQQEVETNKSLLNDLLQRSRENDVILSGTPNNVLMVDRALTPRLPAGPDRVQYVLVAFLLALVGSAGFAVLRGRNDDSLLTPEDVEVGLLMPVLSEIPSAQPVRRRLAAAPVSREGEDDGMRTAPLFGLDADSVSKEAYLHLRTNVLGTNVLGAAHDGPPRVILIASGRPEEGKTTTAVNLARVLAETGERVLLVDADLRNPSLGPIFGFEGRGLSNLLTEPINAEAIKAAVHLDPATRLYVLPAGEDRENPATLLSSARMRQLVTFLRGHFAYVVIDSPPALMFTDAAVLSALSDAFLLVVRSGKSSQEVVSRTRKTLQDRGAQLFGVVLNDASRPKDMYPYEPKSFRAAAGK